MNSAVAIKKKNRVLNKESLILSVLLSISVPFVIFIAVPFDIFCGNFDEFNCRLSDFIPLCSVMFLFFSTTIFIILSLLKGTVYRIVSSALLGLAVMLFIQSNFMNRGIESLAGDNTETVSVSTLTVVLNLILWIAVIAVFAVCGAVFIKKADIVRSVSIVLALTTLIPYFVSCITLMFTTEDLFGKNYSDAPYFSTIKNLTTLSKNKNVFVFCIDRFDDKFYEYASENTPEIFEELDGFTYFNNCTSLYGHTYPSVAYMLTGKKFDATSRKEFLNNVYEDAQTFRTLKDNGYKINVYTKSFYAFDSGRGLGPWCDNFIEADMNDYNIKNPAQLSFLMVKMALFRCLPYALKRTVGSLGSDDANHFIEYNIDYPVYSLDMKKVYDNVTDSEFELTDDKVFSFIHIEGCHSARYDEEWEKQINIDTTDPEEINVSLRHSFEIIDEYIREMKKDGIYENATIIITGDHAIPVTDYSELKSERLTVLLVKPSGDTENIIKISAAPVSHKNLWGTIFESENISSDIDVSPSVFNINEDDASPRYYYWHEFSRSKTTYSELVYRIDGNARDFKNWTLAEEDVHEGTLYE